MSPPHPSPHPLPRILKIRINRVKVKPAEGSNPPLIHGIALTDLLGLIIIMPSKRSILIFFWYYIELFHNLTSHECASYVSTHFYTDTQVPRYLLFCEGGIFSAHALSLCNYVE